MREASRYSGLGCTFAAVVLAFLAGGWLLDRALHVTPVFSVIGALIGAALGVVWLYRKLQVGEAEREREREP